MKDDLSQKLHGNIRFSVYSVKMVFLFAANLILPFYQKSNDNLLPKKNTLKYDISGIIENDDIYPRKFGILLAEKLR